MEEEEEEVAIVGDRPPKVRHYTSVTVAVVAAAVSALPFRNKHIWKVAVAAIIRSIRIIRVNGEK